MSLISLIRNFVDILISLFLLPKNISVIITNKKLISTAENICIQTAGGFGHTFHMLDVARILFEKKFIYIRFFERQRHNIYLSNILHDNNLTIFNTILFSYKKKKIELGEKESTKYKISEIILIKLINLIARKNSILLNYDIYHMFEKKYHHLTNDKIYDKDHAYIAPYFSILTSKKLHLNTDYLKKLLIKEKAENYLEFLRDKSKNVAIYLRKRKGDQSSVNRNGSPKDQYITTIKYLLEKKKNIFLTGDKIFTKEELISLDKNIIDCNYVNKNLIQILKIYFNCISENFIGEYGGGQYFAFYAKKSCLINVFPPTEFPNKIQVLFKKIYDKELGRFLTLDENKKFYKKINFEDKYIIHSNKEDEILALIKNFI